MSSKKPRPSKTMELTPEISKQICAFIRSGAFPHIAAGACGVSRDEFESWLSMGDPTNRKKGWKPHPVYTPFWRDVLMAKSQARIRAEMAVLSGNPDLGIDPNPESWLKNGPGKDRQDDPGWSSSVRPVVHENNMQVNLLLSPQMQGMFSAMLQALSPWPEARMAIADLLAQGDSSTRSARRVLEIQPSATPSPEESSSNEDD